VFGSLVWLPIAWVALALALSLPLHFLSGWEELQTAFPDRNDEVRNTFRLRWARLTHPGRIPVSFGPSFSFDICRFGLRVRLLPMFSWISKPLFVPWDLVSTDGNFAAIGSSLYLGRPFIGCLWLSSWVAYGIEQGKKRALIPAP
jgi:hypothetical protein